MVDTSDLAVVQSELASALNPVLVAAGGDGTLSLASRLARPSGAAIVPMPMGTENLLARRLGYEPTAAAVQATIDADQDCEIDSMEVELPSRRHEGLVMATVGFDAAVVRRVHLRRSGHIRRWTYAMPIAREIIEYPFGELTVRAGQRSVSCRWAMVFNVAAYAANLPIAPLAKPDDGLLDVVCFGGRTVADGLRYLAAIMTGRHDRLGDVTNLRAAEVSMTSDVRIAVQCDGDYVGRMPGGGRAVSMRCQPASVRLLSPGSGLA